MNVNQRVLFSFEIVFVFAIVKILGGLRLNESESFFHLASSPEEKLNLSLSREFLFWPKEPLK